jgi:hypothetical protein
MDERRALHPFCKLDDIFRADDVCAKRAFQSRIEGDVASAIDDHINVRGNKLRFLFSEAKIGFTYVAAHDLNFVADETIEGVAPDRA